MCVELRLWGPIAHCNPSLPEPVLQSGWRTDVVNRSLESETEHDSMYDCVKSSAGGDPQYTATLPFRNSSSDHFGCRKRILGVWNKILSNACVQSLVGGWWDQQHTAVLHFRKLSSTHLEPFLQSGWREDVINRRLGVGTKHYPVRDCIKSSAGGDPQPTATLPFRNQSPKVIGERMS